MIRATSPSWPVRYAEAQLAVGRPVPSWLHLSVQMWFSDTGCSVRL